MQRLDGLGVTLRTRWSWRGWDPAGAALFDTADGPATEGFDVCVLALGGASWPRLGATGDWVDMLAQSTPFRPSNVGFSVNWSGHMTRHAGAPLKNVRLCAGDLTSRGECILTARGLEGGGIYEVSRALVDGAELQIDLLPDVALSKLTARLDQAKPKQSRSELLRKSLKLDPLKAALFQEVHAGSPMDRASLAVAAKALMIPLTGPFPIEEAISTAGGLLFSALDETLAFHTRPTLFAAGEMLDWDAPTGGYLLTACLAT
ncbi:MAG: TIGR03862 family flavoprotein, partial [Planctomycetota bacterium]